MRAFSTEQETHNGHKEIICLGLDGGLVPEMWIEVSQQTGITAFARQSRRT